MLRLLKISDDQNREGASPNFKSKVPQGSTAPILCNPNGSHAGLDYNGKFVQTLRQHAVEFNIVDITISGGSMVIPIDPKPKMKGKSKLKRWTCGCQLVRVGKREFSATCDICGNKFRLDE